MNEITFIRYHKVFSAIVLFFTLFSSYHFILKPSLTYFPDGGFRPFGFEYTNETFFPIWIVSILLGIFSYLVILYVCSIPAPLRSMAKKSRRYRSSAK